jgi:hypothetical protein
MIRRWKTMRRWKTGELSKSDPRSYQASSKVSVRQYRICINAKAGRHDGRRCVSRLHKGKHGEKLGEERSKVQF